MVGYEEYMRASGEDTAFKICVAYNYNHYLKYIQTLKPQNNKLPKK